MCRDRAGARAPVAEGFHHHPFRAFVVWDHSSAWVTFPRAPLRSRTVGLSGREMARTGLRMMPTSPSTSLRFRTAGSPRYGSKAGLSSGPSHLTRRLNLLPVYPLRRTVCVHSSCSPWPLPVVPFCVGTVARWNTAMRAAFATLPQGPSLRSGLYCPGPSSLNRPHPPHSQARRDFPAEPVIRDTFAVREHLGDPRVVPCFR